MIFTLTDEGGELLTAAENREKAERLQCILNLSLQLIARKASPAERESAERLLLELMPAKVRSNDDRWHIRAKKACLKWQTL